MKEVIKKHCENGPKRKDDEKTTNDANDRINMIIVDFMFSRIKLSLKLSLKLVEFK